uniref:Uncharacterized protein n=1 Tax=Anguilla anguilla TaxID=7936 RepID=A0A0E9VV30_ANGAN
MFSKSALQIYEAHKGELYQWPKKRVANHIKDVIEFQIN